MIIRADEERNAFSPSSTMLYTLLQDKSSNMPYVTLDVCKINASLNESNGLNLFVWESANCNKFTTFTE